MNKQQRGELALKTIKRIQKVVAEQAKDEGLWFWACSAPEGYLQKALRKLHRIIEAAANHLIKGRNDD